jgi:hypothetical protein
MAFGISRAFLFGLRSIRVWQACTRLCLYLSSFDARLFGPYRRVVLPLHLRNIEICGFLLFALADWRAYCIGILFELATAPYIISILSSSEARDR